MITRTETLIIGAAVALAMVPRFEAKVEQYAQTHRTEIQMAMNELQGKPAVPFAAPDVTTDMRPTFALASDVQTSDREQMDADMTQVRAEIAAIQPRAWAATSIPMLHSRQLEERGVSLRVGHPNLAQVRAQAAGWRALAARQRAMAAVYRVRTLRCSVAPAVPQSVRFLEDNGS